MNRSLIREQEELVLNCFYHCNFVLGFDKRLSIDVAADFLKLSKRKVKKTVCLYQQAMEWLQTDQVPLSLSLTISETGDSSRDRVWTLGRLTKEQSEFILDKVKELNQEGRSSVTTITLLVFIFACLHPHL